MLLCATFVGGRVLLGSEQGHVRLWDPREEAAELVAIADAAVWACASRGATEAVLGTRDGRLLHVDFSGRDPRLVTAIGPWPQGPVTRVAAGAGDLAVGLPGAGHALFWDLDRGETVPAQAVQGLWTRGLALDPRRGARRAASTSDDSALLLWDVANGAVIDTLTTRAALGEAPCAVTFGPDGRLYAGTFAGVVLELEVR